MKSLKFIIPIFLITLFGLTNSFAQKRNGSYLYSEGKLFKEVQKEMETFYKDRDKGKGTGYKQWKRWEAWMNGRQNPDGTIPNTTLNNQKAIRASKLNNEDHLQGKDNTKSTTGLWENIGPNAIDQIIRDGAGKIGLGRVNCIAFHESDPNTLYLGAPAGGFWRTTDGGLTWEPKMQDEDMIGVSSIAVQNGAIYALTGDGDSFHSSSVGVLKSTDNGETWTHLPLPWESDETVYGYKIHAAQNGNLYIATTNGFYISNVDQTEWLLYYDGYIHDFKFSTTNPNRIFLSGVEGGRMGLAYIVPFEIGVPTPSREYLSLTSDRIALAISSGAPERGYILEGAGIGTGSSANPFGFGGFSSWDNGDITILTPLTNTPNIMSNGALGQNNADQHRYDIAMIVNPDDSDHIIVGGIALWESLDAGQSWNYLAAIGYSDTVAYDSIIHPDIHALEYNPLDGKLYCGNDGGIYVSDDFGDSWTDISEGLSITQIYRIDGINGEIFSIGSQDNGTTILDNSGVGFEVGGGDGMDTKLNPNDPDSIYFSAQSGSLRFSWNRGKQGSVTNIVPPGATNGTWTTPIEIRSDQFNTIFTGFQDTVYWSTNFGFPNSWNAAFLSIPNGDDRLKFIKVNFDNTRVFAATDKHIFTSLIDGISSASWTDVTGNIKDLLRDNSGLNITSIETSLTKVYITLSGNVSGQKIYSNNPSASNDWSNISHNLPNTPLNCAMLNKGTELYVGSDIGVYRLNLGSSNWQLFKQGMPRVPVMDLDKNTNRDVIYAATFGRGIWRSGAYGDCSKTEYLTGRREEFGGNDTSSSNPGDQYIKASARIESTRIINASSNNHVIYQAGNVQLLKPGFHAKENSFFKATVDKECTFTDPEAN